MIIEFFKNLLFCEMTLSTFQLYKWYLINMFISIKLDLAKVLEKSGVLDFKKHICKELIGNIIIIRYQYQILN